MPLYLFVCDTCYHEFEDLVKLSDAEFVRCPMPNCAGKTTKQPSVIKRAIYKNSNFGTKGGEGK